MVKFWPHYINLINRIQSNEGVNFINVKRACFFVRKLHFGSFSGYVSALAPKFRTKNVRVNVDEIDTRRWTKIVKIRLKDPFV